MSSCFTCKNCVKKDEQYCASGSTFTYGGVTAHGHAGRD